jgi:hypothetical protein
MRKLEASAPESKREVEDRVCAALIQPCRSSQIRILGVLSPTRTLPPPDAGATQGGDNSPVSQGWLRGRRAFGQRRFLDRQWASAQLVGQLRCALLTLFGPHSMFLYSRFCLYRQFLHTKFLLDSKLFCAVCALQVWYRSCLDHRGAAPRKTQRQVLQVRLPGKKSEETHAKNTPSLMCRC